MLRDRLFVPKQAWNKGRRRDERLVPTHRTDVSGVQSRYTDKSRFLAALGMTVYVTMLRDSHFVPKLAQKGFRPRASNLCSHAHMRGGREMQKPTSPLAVLAYFILGLIAIVVAVKVVFLLIGAAFFLLSVAISIAVVAIVGYIVYALLRAAYKSSQ